jgi:hypothetical protein
MSALRPFDKLRVLSGVEAQAQGGEQSRTKGLLDKNAMRRRKHYENKRNT